jgi:hypothetical protein
MIIWGNGTAACAGNGDPLSLMTVAGPDSDKVLLTIPKYFTASPGQLVSLPLTLDVKEEQVSSLVFSIDYDQARLSFDAADLDQDGAPDGIQFNLPQGFVASAMFDPADADGEIDVVIYHLGLPQAALPSGELLSISFLVGEPDGTFLAEVNSSNDPPASFGSPAGASLPGTLEDGSILIFDTSSNHIFLPVTLFEE